MPDYGISSQQASQLRQAESFRGGGVGMGEVAKREREVPGSVGRLQTSVSELENAIEDLVNRLGAGGVMTPHPGMPPNTKEDKRSMVGLAMAIETQTERIGVVIMRLRAVNQNLEI